MPEPYRIDVHHHVATQNNPLYDVPDGMSWWSVDNALRVMDGNQIRVAMLSPSGHLPQQYGLVRLMTSLRDGPAGHSRPVRALIRRAVRTANQEVAQIASARPDRFGFFASLMLPHPGDAADEAKYALDELGADGCFLPTNFGSLYLGDGVFEPLFTELGKRGAVAFVHPMSLPCPLVPGIPAYLADFLLSTVRAATTRRHPRIRFILSHGGGFVPFAVQRFAEVLAWRHPERAKDDYLAEYARFYFDLAAVTAPSAVTSLLDFAGHSQVLYGSDFPFSQPDLIQAGIRQLDTMNLGDEAGSAISYGNAKALFPRLQPPSHPATGPRSGIRG